MLPLVNMTSHKVMFGRPDERPDFIQIYKAALDMMDLAGGPCPCRRPLLELPDADLAVLHDLVSELVLTSATRLTRGGTCGSLRSAAGL
jgi:hypothetical protein